MKLFTLISILFVFTSSQIQKQEIKLDGEYKMIYETEYTSENCIIKINGATYVKKLNNGSKKKGKITEQKLKVVKLFFLRDYESELEVEVMGDTYKPSDTIYFRTKKIGEKDNPDDIVISSGQLIKIK